MIKHMDYSNVYLIIVLQFFWMNTSLQQKTLKVWSDKIIFL